MSVILKLRVQTKTLVFCDFCDLDIECIFMFDTFKCLVKTQRLH